MSVTIRGDQRGTVAFVKGCALISHQTSRVGIKYLLTGSKHFLCCRAWKSNLISGNGGFFKLFARAAFHWWRLWNVFFPLRMYIAVTLRPYNYKILSISDKCTLQSRYLMLSGIFFGRWLFVFALHVEAWALRRPIHDRDVFTDYYIFSFQ